MVSVSITTVGRRRGSHISLEEQGNEFGSVLDVGRDAHNERQLSYAEGNNGDGT
jgi:hypothetical protein